MSAKKTKKTTTTAASGGVRQAKARAKRGGTPVPAAKLDELVAHASKVRERAYAPYSKYLVGAAILTKSGRVYTGCNVENSTFPASICAEQSAVVQMVAGGDREIVACAVVTGDDGASPCGVCRQVLAEFAGDDVPIVMVGLGGKRDQARRAVLLGELLPLAFRLANE